MPTPILGPLKLIEYIPHVPLALLGPLHVSPFPFPPFSCYRFVLSINCIIYQCFILDHHIFALYIEHNFFVFFVFSGELPILEMKKKLMKGKTKVQREQTGPCKQQQIKLMYRCILVFSDLYMYMLNKHES